MATCTNPLRSFHRDDIYWQHAWQVASERYTPQPRPGPAHADDASFRRELLFCLLGGFGITYELNRSASELMWARGVLAGPRRFDALEIEAELGRAQFDPPRADGRPRRYRYPKHKARLLADCQDWLGRRPSLIAELGALADERDRREILCDCPGLGLKSASWLLRNVGLARDLAILDVHVLRAMRECGRVERVRLPDDYELVERVFLKWCAELGAEPAGFDLLVWDFSRRRIS